MRELTGKQREVLAFIRTFIGKHGVPPTVREIGDRDLVLVRRQDSAAPNDIVVALVESESGEGEATVKRFSREGERVVLKPEHPTMAPIIVDPRHTPLRILGKVVGVLRGF